MHPVIWILLILVFCAGGAAFGYMYRKDMVEKKINRSEETARRLYDDAVRKADDYKKEKVFEAKEEILKARATMDAEKASYDREIRDRRAEVQRSENRLMQREASLDKRSDSLDNRENDLKKRSDNLDRKEEEVDRLQEEAEEIHRKQTTELERIAAMTQDEAKQIIIERVQKEAFHDAAAMVREIDTGLSIHDFRMVRGTGHTNLMTKERWQKVQLFRDQKKTLDTFLAKNAISQKQYDKSYGDLQVLMDMHGVE